MVCLCVGGHLVGGGREGEGVGDNGDFLFWLAGGTQPQAYDFMGAQRFDGRNANVYRITPKHLTPQWLFNFWQKMCSCSCQKIYILNFSRYLNV